MEPHETTFLLAAAEMGISHAKEALTAEAKRLRLRAEMDHHHAAAQARLGNPEVVRDVVVPLAGATGVPVAP